MQDKSISDIVTFSIYHAGSASIDLT